MPVAATMSALPINGEAIRFYQHVLDILASSGIPFLLGGAYAVERYTGMQRPTKDLDLMVRAADCPSVLRVLSAAGYETELTFPHWLGKVFSGPYFIDVIFSAGNGTARVDDDWFTHAVSDEVLGRRARVASPEDLIWSKAFVMERDRYDGADIAHLIRACAETIDWQRLLDRFGPHWRVLFSHLVLFGFIYPTERSRVPNWVMRQLSEKLVGELAEPVAGNPVCQGTLLSREQYLPDLRQLGYADARLSPRGTMTQEDIERWTAAIGQDD